MDPARPDLFLYFASGAESLLRTVSFCHSYMSREVPIPNDPISSEEAAAFARLREAEVKDIDDAILSCATSHWQKVARMVSLAEKKLASKYPQFSYSLYAERIRLLAGEGRLESQGDLSFMRFSEVRLPHEN